MEATEVTTALEVDSGGDSSGNHQDHPSNPPNPPLSSYEDKSGGSSSMSGRSERSQHDSNMDASEWSYDIDEELNCNKVWHIYNIYNNLAYIYHADTYTT